MLQRLYTAATQKRVVKTDYSLIQVKSIAECSKGSILQYLRPSFNYHLSLPIFKWPFKTGFTEFLVPNIKVINSFERCVILMIFISSADIFFNNQESISVIPSSFKQIGARSGPIICLARSRSKLFAEDKSRYLHAIIYSWCYEGINAKNKLTLCMLGIFSCFCCLLTFLSKNNFFEYYFMNNIRVSNGLDPDQDRRCVGPDLGPNCLQILSVDDKSGL